MARSECGEPHSPLALLSQQLELEALMEAGVELDFHSPEYAKFRMEQEHVEEEEISPCKEFLLDSPGSDLDTVFDISEWVNEDDAELEAILEAAEAELNKATQTLQCKARAKRLEDEETKALMRKWSLNDRAFEAVPMQVSSPDEAIVDAAPPPPALANGLGPVLHMRNGGSLRSMSPTHFNAASGERLLMQVSNPVVVPSEMGATSVAVLRRMAVSGMDAMGTQAMAAMPLQDIAGVGVDQLLLEQRDRACRLNGMAALGNGERDGFNVRERSARGKRSGGNGEFYMGLEDLAPMAMARIEALALEGLKIQAEMAEENAPCVVEPAGIPPLRVQGAKDEDEEDRLMSRAISLDEWKRLDAGENEREDPLLAITAAKKDSAPSNRSKDLASKSHKHRDFSKAGCMGQTVTLAMLVQLRDPYRRNEAVGLPMMALVQAERVVVPPKPKLVRRVASLPGKKTHEQENDRDDKIDKNGKHVEDNNPQFKIVDVTVAGLKSSQSSPAKKTEAWGNKKQLQAGSRWLLAQGMQKATKPHPALKTKAPQVRVQPGDSLWSISARVHGSGAKWRDLARLNPHIRNPDIIFPDTSIRTR